ncbi:MAG: 2-C-methyl-D-erythritol 4-phosphate cytidylyltransferase [Lachnospiraceae bacterium]|nr:2-C-methyl-D-erythritol 4-phosphate cytidylyltransferase [Lachnospiraceae bacterium]
MEEIKSAAVILAGGTGKRMGGDVPKQYLELCGHPLLYYAIDCFEKSSVSEIVLVVTPGDEEKVRKDIVDRYGFKKVSSVVAGGKERYNSSYNGIRAISDADILLIHDAARALVTVDVIEHTIKDAYEYGACVAAVPSKDTIKLSDAEGFVESTIDRSRAWIIQTPQSFRITLIKAAYEQAEKEASDKGLSGFFTDDAMVAERYSGQKVKITMGSYENIKVTTPDDLQVAEEILINRKN